MQYIPFFRLRPRPLRRALCARATLLAASIENPAAGIETLLRIRHNALFSVHENDIIDDFGRLCFQKEL